VPGGVDQVETAVDAGVLDVTVAHHGELFAEVSAVLVFDVFDDRVPAVLVVDLVAIHGRVDDIHSQLDAVFDDDV